MRINEDDVARNDIVAVRMGRKPMIDDNTARRIAAWWYSPRDKALVELATIGTVTNEDAIIHEILVIRREVAVYGDKRASREIAELQALTAWVEARP